MAKLITVFGLDLGSYSIKILAGQKELKTSDVSLLTQLEIPQFGMRKGEVFNSSRVAQNIIQAKNRIKKSGIAEPKRVVVNIGGSRIYVRESQGLVSVSRADRKISAEDIQRVIQASKAVNLEANKEVIEVFPREFVINGEGGIEDPLGLEGVRLEVRALLLSVFSPVLENLENAVAEADLEIEDIIAAPLAVARAVLTEEQKEVGVALVDIGGETTSVCFFDQGKLIGLSVFPIGSASITNDIALGLRTEISTAERIKREFVSLALRKKKKQKIDLPENGLSFSSKLLGDIVEPRASEIISEVQKEVKRISKKNLLPGGIVLTGGGAKLPGMMEFTRQRLKLPCRLGKIQGISGVDDLSFATCSGLVLSGFDKKEERREISSGWLRERLKRIFKMFLP